MPRLSIIIATYNVETTLEKCLDSIFNQSFTDYEVLIADGQSSDNTIEIIKKYSSQLAFWKSERDSGIYDAWNKMLDIAKGEYICFLGADDRLHEIKSLENLFIAFDKANYDIVTCKALLIGGKREHVVGGAWNYKNLWKKMGVIHPGMLHHRSLFDRHGSFDASLKIVGDYEFLLRLPPETTSFHFDDIVTDIGCNGVSRTQFNRMLLEKRDVQTRCIRIGRLKANYNYFNKLWRAPIARLLKLPY
jgi:glycosyltransferase involved in cell wall biosynthesis